MLMPGTRSWFRAGAAQNAISSAKYPNWLMEPRRRPALAGRLGLARLRRRRRIIMAQIARIVAVEQILPQHAGENDISRRRRHNISRRRRVSNARRRLGPAAPVLCRGDRGSECADDGDGENRFHVKNSLGRPPRIDLRPRHRHRYCCLVHMMTACGGSLWPGFASQLAALVPTVRGTSEISPAFTTQIALTMISSVPQLAGLEIPPSTPPRTTRNGNGGETPSRPSFPGGPARP